MIYFPLNDLPKQRWSLVWAKQETFTILNSEYFTSCCIDFSCFCRSAKWHWIGNCRNFLSVYFILKFVFFIHLFVFLVVSSENWWGYQEPSRGLNGCSFFGFVITLSYIWFFFFFFECNVSVWAAYTECVGVYTDIFAYICIWMYVYMYLCVNILYFALDKRRATQQALKGFFGQICLNSLMWSLL